MTDERRPTGLPVQIGYNAVAQLVPLVVAFAITPLLLHKLGLDRYGVWAFAVIVLTTLAALDGGVSASLARFFALHGVQRDRHGAGRLLVGSMLAFALLALFFSLVAIPLAPAVVPLLNIPRTLHPETIQMLRWLPALAALGLASDATAALLEGNGRFQALAVSTLVSSVTYVVAVLVLVQGPTDFPKLLVATALRYLALAIVSLLAAHRHVLIRRPLLPTRETARELWRFSSRMQLSALTSFVNSELDGLVIAAVLPVRYVGLYAIGMQAASAARSLPLYAFSPLLTVLAQTFGHHGRAATRAEFIRLERIWIPAVVGYGLVAIAGIGFSVTVWLGRQYRLAGLTAVILLAGYVVHVGLTGMRTCYVRAVGRPGLETRYSSVWTFGNAILTVPLALLGGLLGVVGATAITGIIASVYFVWLCARTEHLGFVVPARRWWYSAIAAVALTVAGELAILQLDIHGFLALALTGVPALAALGLLRLGAGRLPPAPVTS